MENKNLNTEINESFNSDKDEDYGKRKNSNPHNCKALKFNISINEKEFTQIKPEEYFSANGRKYYQLKPMEWTNTMTDKIVEQIKELKLGLPCTFNYKKHTVYKSENQPFFNFEGYCADCKTTIFGECKRAYLNNDTKIVNIQTYDTSGVHHLEKKKRRCIGSKKNTNEALLIYQKPKSLRNKMLNEKGEYGRREPVDLQTSQNLRKMRQRAIEKDLGLEVNNSKGLIKSLLQLKLNFNVIREINRFPIYCIYYSAEQMLMWQELGNTSYLRASADASGSFVLPFSVKGIKSAHIFLHSLVSWYEGYDKIIPLTQMITERQDTNIIRHWLAKSSENNPKPREMICDQSLALLNAICLSYNDVPYKKYLELCFMILNNQNLNQNPPECFVRLDRAHVIKAATRWKAFSSTKHKDAKDFYLRCIGYAFTIKSLQLLKDVLYSILVVSGSQTCDMNSESEKSKMFLFNKFEKFDFKELNSFLQSDDILKNIKLEDEEFSENNDDEMENVSHLKSFITDVKEKASEHCKGSQISIESILNPYYLKEIQENIIFLFCQFPAWTNVMMSYFKSPFDTASSCRSEGNFKNLRALIPFPLNADKMIATHLRSIKGDLIEAKAAIDIIKQKSAQKLIKNEIQVSDLQPNSTNNTNSTNSTNNSNDKNIINSCNNNNDNRKLKINSINYKSFGISDVELHVNRQNNVKNINNSNNNIYYDTSLVNMSSNIGKIRIPTATIRFIESTTCNQKNTNNNNNNNNTNNNNNNNLTINVTINKEEKKMNDKDYILKKVKDEVVIKFKFGIQLTAKSFRTLHNLNWLDDNVINFYLQLLVERNKRYNLSKIYAFSTFFYLKLKTDGNKSVKKWTKKVDIFKYEKVFVPVHINNNHWCLSVIDFQNNSIKYYNSLGSPNNECLKLLESYISWEHNDKKKLSLCTDDWELVNEKDIPKQKNGSDCDVFLCMYVKNLSVDKKFLFSQKDMPAIRDEMMSEILNEKVL